MSTKASERAPTNPAEPDPLCICKDRPLSQCPGEWEPGCDLGANEKFVRVEGLPPIPTANEWKVLPNVPLFTTAQLLDYARAALEGAQAKSAEPDRYDRMTDAERRVFIAEAEKLADDYLALNRAYADLLEGAQAK